MNVALYGKGDFASIIMSTILRWEMIWNITWNIQVKPECIPQCFYKKKAVERLTADKGRVAMEAGGFKVL